MASVLLERSIKSVPHKYAAKPNGNAYSSSFLATTVARPITGHKHASTATEPRKQNNTNYGREMANDIHPYENVKYSERKKETEKERDRAKNPDEGKIKICRNHITVAYVKNLHGGKCGKFNFMRN